MERHSEHERPWTKEEKEQFLDRTGGFELEAGELDTEEIRSLLEKEVSDERS